MAKLSSAWEDIRPENISADSLDVEKIIAGVGRPRYEFDRTAPGRSSAKDFIYLTTEVCLVTRYGTKSLEAIKLKRDEFDKVVLTQVRKSPRLRNKPELCEMLYVRGIDVNPDDLSLTAHVGFRECDRERARELQLAPKKKTLSVS